MKKEFFLNKGATQKNRRTEDGRDKNRQDSNLVRRLKKVSVANKNNPNNSALGNKGK